MNFGGEIPPLLVEVDVGGFLGIFNGLGPFSNLEISPCSLEVDSGVALGFFLTLHLGSSWSEDDISFTSLYKLGFGVPAGCGDAGGLGIFPVEPLLVVVMVSPGLAVPFTLCSSFPVPAWLGTVVVDGIKNGLQATLVNLFLLSHSQKPPTLKHITFKITYK